MGFKEVIMGYKQEILKTKRGKHNFTPNEFQEQVTTLFDKYKFTHTQRSAERKAADPQDALQRYIHTNEDSVKLAALEDMSQRLADISYVLLKMYTPKDANGYIKPIEEPNRTILTIEFERIDKLVDYVKYHTYELKERMGIDLDENESKQEDTNLQNAEQQVNTASKPAKSFYSGYESDPKPESKSKSVYDGYVSKDADNKPEDDSEQEDDSNRPSSP
ncbi:MAG: hypothetical protein H0U75_11965 [Legionella sp.]|nr:hypothetical protein [Legionella sp.]